MSLEDLVQQAGWMEWYAADWLHVTWSDGYRDLLWLTSKTASCNEREVDPCTLAIAWPVTCWISCILECGFEEMRHPPYSPDLAPSDYHLFQNLKNKSSPWTDIFHRWWAQVCNRRVVEGLELFYFTGIEKLRDRYKQWIYKSGDYVENRCMHNRVPFV